MSIMLRTALIVISLLTLWYTARKIRKAQLQIEDSIFWMAFPAALVILSVATWAAKMLGVQSPVNFIFLAVIFILIVKTFSLSLRISQLDTKIRTLTQEIAIREKLQQEKKELQDAVDGYTGVNGESHKVESLLQTATDYLSDPQDYEAIADTLYNVDTDYVQNSATDAYKQLYNKLMELVGSQVAEQMYRDGSAAINQSDYTTAISTLQKAWYFTQNMETPDPEVLYELAQAYQMAGETDKAKEAYNQILQEYAQSQTAGKASERLTELGDSGDNQNMADTNTTTDQQAEDTQTVERQPADGQAEQQTQ